MAPAMVTYKITVNKLLDANSPTATFISNPGVGEAETDDEIGTESRSSNGIWDE